MTICYDSVIMYLDSVQLVSIIKSCGWQFHYASGDTDWAVTMVTKTMEKNMLFWLIM